jgi:glycosyltransferase involved in cell wall biosynthesis
MNVPDPRLFGKPAVERLNVDVRGNAGTQCGFRIVHHGTLVERYGADLALLAFAEAVSAMPDAHFYLYGTGDFRPELKRHVDRLNLAQRAHLSDGALPLDAMPSVLAGADIGVVPHRDGPIMKWALPTKMMEYVALGIPVIVARTEVISEYFDDSMVMFFEPGNASDLARCILKLYREPELRRSLARNAARFLEEHSWDKEKLKLYSLVDSLTS